MTLLQKAILLVISLLIWINNYFYIFFYFFRSMNFKEIFTQRLYMKICVKSVHFSFIISVRLITYTFKDFEESQIEHKIHIFIYKYFF